jgi:hypothetical protein
MRLPLFAAILLFPALAIAKTLVAPIVSDFAMASAAAPFDWDPIIQGLALAMTSIVIPWAILAYQKHTGVLVTDQQRAAVQAALTTAAGQIETLIDQGRLNAADLSPQHPVVIQAAEAALARVPDAATAQNVRLTAAAEIIVGRVNTSPKPPVIVVPAGPAVTVGPLAAS